MRDTAFRAPQRRSFRIAATAIPTVVALALGGITQANALPSLPISLSDYIKPGDSQQPAPTRTDVPQIQGLPEGVSVDRVEWLSSRRVAVYINSPSMPQSPVQVQILLARDWHSQPDRTFPEVWALDGMRARDDENGWTSATNLEQFYSDKNVNVILPVGGESSFYSDWLEEDNGRHYKWESFLINELVPVLDKGFRSNGDRAITGISMGATAAVNLAAHNPGLFSFVGSFSGYLDTTTPGMPAAINAAMSDAGGYSATKMWGPYGSEEWKNHDPKRGLDALKGTPVYVSAGSGREENGKVTVPEPAARMTGMGLEAVSRMTTQTFVNHAKKAGVDVTARFRDAGIHSWYYWQFEMTQAWPLIADSLGVHDGDRGAECAPIGAIAEATQDGGIGSCVNNEYDVAGGAGKAQDFQNGTAYWSEATGAHVLFGRINARYAELGGPASWLGFPRSTELSSPDGKGKYVLFEHGAIYWSQETGAFPVNSATMDAWGGANYETGELGYPVSDTVVSGDSRVQQFQNGVIVSTGEGEDAKAFRLSGAIGQKYAELGAATSWLGMPTSNVIRIPGGALQQFEQGNIYHSESSGAHAIRYGAIFDAWGEDQWEQGPFGWPTADQAEIPAGGEYVQFQHGKISQVNGQINKERS
ncbi:alpha/beta hydrolase-fold protein [Corynebacterium oculi]|uniref:Diacylglycerol acyltransferase/mycolyltransferase Ag85B n=1 Tax=Corynebacterium oculi TaxID=1544416 RepID=A0A0Q0YBI4_9CORY|nr:alpha/beta hydrolase-fold protein [Corynebacterium oculi]KQB83344.1 Diacylglycerol acyltransferase/mycolyltransferase Ag85B precursor [Corynebacterium oculi]